jgi:formate dehydrogenase major subunit
VYNSFKETEEIVQHGKEYPYIITTNRELEHYNCGAMTRRTGNELILKDDYLMINPLDAEKHLINEGDYVCIESPRGKVDVKARITDEVKSGVLSTTFHFPEMLINILTGDVHDSEAKCPEYKVVAVRIRKSKGNFKKAKETVS